MEQEAGWQQAFLRRPLPKPAIKTKPVGWEYAFLEDSNAYLLGGIGLISTGFERIPWGWNWSHFYRIRTETVWKARQIFTPFRSSLAQLEDVANQQTFIDRKCRCGLGARNCCRRILGGNSSSHEAVHGPLRNVSPSQRLQYKYWTTHKASMTCFLLGLCMMRESWVTP